MNLIGINGFKTSGKDTTYRLVGEILDDQKVVRRAFADKLKIMAAKALGIEGEDSELIRAMDHFKETGRLQHSYIEPVAVGYGPNGPPDPFRRGEITGREYLQNFGAKAREVFGDTFWVDQILPNPATDCYSADIEFQEILANKTWLMFDEADWGCVTDVRYENEAQRVLDLGGEVWEIVRPGIESDGHSSEKPLPRELVTRTILNDSTLDDLSVKISNALGEFNA